jgi:hypothetical protein
LEHSDNPGYRIKNVQKLEIPREVILTKDGRFIKWTQSLRVPPGRTGSAITWIEIPRY